MFKKERSHKALRQLLQNAEMVYKCVDILHLGRNAAVNNVYSFKSHFDAIDTSLTRLSVCNDVGKLTPSSVCRDVTLVTAVTVCGDAR